MGIAGRYEWLYELRPIPIREKVLEEVTKHILKDLESWPPPVSEWLDARQADRFAPLYEESTRPPAALFRRSLQLVRWEMLREFEAIDHCMRNRLWEQDEAGPQAEAALLLIWRWLTEILLAVREHSQQKLSREDLVKIVDRLEPTLAPSALRTSSE